MKRFSRGLLESSIVSLNSIDLDQRLPSRLTIKSVDNYLYKIGLSPTSTRIGDKRYLLHEPNKIFALLVIQFIKNTIFYCSFGQKSQSITTIGRFDSFVCNKTMLGIPLPDIQCGHRSGDQRSTHLSSQ